MRQPTRLLSLLAVTVFTSSCIDLNTLLGPDNPFTPPSTEGGTTEGASPEGRSWPAYQREQLSDQSGESDPDQDLRTVSAEYSIRLTGEPAGTTALIDLPVKADLLPEGVTNSHFVTEQYDASRGEWRATGSLPWYDAENGRVYFRAQLPAATLQTQQEAEGARFRIRVYLFSNEMTAYREGSQFRFHYYPAHLTRNKSRIRSDSEWNSSTGNATEAQVPDFIEDLDAALNTAYQAMLKLPHSGGQVFKALPVQDVYIRDTGGSAGNSSLGGPMTISNRLITAYDDLALTAAHELVHVFQGQYYSLKGLFTGRQNQWFIEAVANYYAAQVTGLNEAQKKEFYGDFYSDYLSEPLTSNSDNSMYAAGHLLDWLSHKYGDKVVGDALRLSQGNDVTGLNKSLQTNGKVLLSTAYEDYLTAILTEPEATAGFHQAVRDAMGTHGYGQGHLSAPGLTRQRPYVRLKKTLPPYTAALTALNLGTLQSGARGTLLVVVNNGNQGALLKGLTYPFESDRNRDFVDALPLDRYLSYSSFKVDTYPWLKAGDTPLTAFNQLVYNASPASSARVDMSYYLLRGLEHDSSDDGRTTVKLDNLKGIPAEYLRGLKTYDYQGKLLVGLTPISTGDTQVLTHDARRYSGHITVTDKFGHEWPWALLGEVIYPDGSGTMEIGGTAYIRMHTIGFEDNDLIWSYSGKGQLSASGKSGTFTGPDQLSVSDTITISSRKYPHITTTVTVSDHLSGCVPAGTPVTLADGSQRAIETLKAGDRIRAYSPEQDSLLTAKVEKVLTHAERKAPLQRLITADGDTLHITDNHPVLTLEKGWIPVAQVTPGMTLYQLDRQTGEFGPTRVVSIIREAGQAQVVYNLKTTAGNYFAQDVLVHNKCLQAGSLIATPLGLRAVETLQPGDQVWRDAAQQVATTVTKVYRKDTILPTLPGKQLRADSAVTINHRLLWQGRWVKAADTDLPDVAIPGAVYDLETADGTYTSGGVLMGA